jgi:hypothetical protein
LKEYGNNYIISPSHEELVLSSLEQLSTSQAISIESSTTENAFLHESVDITKGEFLVETNENNLLTIRIKRKSTG